MAKRSQRVVPKKTSEEALTPRRRATMIAPEGRLVQADSSAVSRLFILLIGNYLHRIERERRGLYDGDLDLALVAEIIGTAAIEPGMRDAAFRAKHSTFESVIGIEGQRAVNATSIASTSGIPRETVRRKLKRLLELGVIVEKGRACYVTKPGTPQRQDQQEAFARGIQQTVLFMNECLENGVVRWVPATKTKRTSG
jgi:hypothetical protein